MLGLTPSLERRCFVIPRNSVSLEEINPLYRKENTNQYRTTDEAEPAEWKIRKVK